MGEVSFPARVVAPECERRQVEADRASLGALVDDDVEAEVLDGGIQILLHAGVEAVDLVDEEDVPLLQVRQDAGEVASPFNLRSAGGVEL